MGLTQSVHQEVEISRSPEEVREVFLDFKSYPQWFEYWTNEPDDSNKPPFELAPGDKLKNVYRGGEISCVVVVNTPESFQIRGSMGGLLRAHHQVYFRPSKIAPGGTMLILHEDFKGPVAFLLRRGSSMRQDLDFTFEQFNVNLKERVEKGASS